APAAARAANRGGGGGGSPVSIDRDARPPSLAPLPRFFDAIAAIVGSQARTMRAITGGTHMLSRARNLIRRVFKDRIRGFLDRSGYPFLLPHVRLIGGGVSALDGPPRQVPAELLHAL